MSRCSWSHFSEAVQPILMNCFCIFGSYKNIDCKVSSELFLFLIISTCHQKDGLQLAVHIPCKKIEVIVKINLTKNICSDARYYVPDVDYHLHSNFLIGDMTIVCPFCF